MFFYSDPNHWADPHSLPNMEVFHCSAFDFLGCPNDSWMDRMVDDYVEEHGCLPSTARIQLEGWYYWFCFPGCLPDGEPTGPFTTMEEAIEHAREE